MLVGLVTRGHAFQGAAYQPASAADARLYVDLGFEVINSKLMVSACGTAVKLG